MRCYGCGVMKDPLKEEVYPWPEEDRLSDEPIQPLFVVACSSTDNKPTTFKATVCCHNCLYRLYPDIWISQQCWESIKPKIQFNDLPLLLDDIANRFDVSRYPELIREDANSKQP